MNSPTLGTRVPHDSSPGHVSGESVFVDDRAILPGELHVGIVGAPVSAGRITKIDTTAALQVPGIVAAFTAQDLHRNRWGTIVHDQPYLVGSGPQDQIGYIDEPVCILAAESPEALKRAQKLVRVDVEASTPIYTIEEALAKNSILYTSKGLVVGNAREAIARAPHRLKGKFEIGGQEHFYLESQAAVAYPGEAQQLVIHSSSQHPTEVQHVVAEALGLQHHQVICEVKRMGGAFGGKESQAAPIAALAALVAHRLKRPARLILNKDDDMRITGKRHPFLCFYDVGFDSEGRILGLEVKLCSNGGAYTDLSPSVLERSVFHIDGSYYLPNATIEAVACKTNMHSNTAFRGFGGPQGNITIENILEEIAIHLGKDAYAVRRMNVYTDQKDVTPYGQRVTNNLIPQIFDDLHDSSHYEKRLNEIRKFNRDPKNSGKLRGIAMTACKFGIAFNARFLNQASALVHVHRDGSVQVSTGVTEMGQGANTKIRQLVADAFAISINDVQVMTTSTEKNANTSPTAASSGTDLNGGAALKACNAILTRMKWAAYCHFNNIKHEGEFPPLDPRVALDVIQHDTKGFTDRASGKTISWVKLVNLTYLNRLSISELGFFRTEGLNFDESTRKGNAFKYFTQGAAVSEVEIDEYTGQMSVRRIDLLMDIGQSINPGIDHGQIVGGFVQGMGWMTNESLWYDSKGHLGSHSPTTYKIPNIQDIPATFNVRCIDNPGNTENVYRSKAVGEPPLLLSASVFIAVKHALSFRTPSTQPPTLPQLRVPATGEEILLELSRLGSR